ncbi:MAG: TonB-dependent receptor [Elusimicrobiota bacterium]
MRFVRANVVAVSMSVLVSTAVIGFSAEVYLSLERKMITASRYEQWINKLPVSASVITKEDIKMSNAKQTTDILGQLPGIFIRKSGDFGRADIDIRGIGGNGRQLGIFIDGRPDKMGVFGCSVTHTLPMNNVERIEVIRGPESVLYGSDAFGGVVNIITKRAAKKLEGNFLASLGTFNTQNYLFQQGSKIDKVDYFISVNKRSTAGHKENSSFKATDYSGQFGYALSGYSDISLSSKYFTGIKNEPFPSAAGTWNDYGRGSVDLTYNRIAGNFNNSLKIYRSFGEHKFSNGFHSKDYTDGLMAHSKTKLLENNELSVGLDYRYQFGDVLNTAPAFMIGHYHKYEYGVYINDEHTFLEKLTLNGGARYNNDEFAKDIVNPKLGVVYNTLNGTILRGIWSRGFRAPQINDLFLWGGNKDLKPEKVTNTEIGLRQKFGESIDLDLAGFIMKGADLIQSRAGKNVNIGDFEFKGIETMLIAKISDSFNTQVNYTYFDPGTQTTGRPGNKAGASLKYSKKKVNAIITGEYAGRYYSGDNSTGKIDDYLLFNTKVDYKLLNNLSVFGAIDNLTDKEYQIYNGGLYTMPKRTLTLGLNYIFG